MENKCTCDCGSIFSFGYLPKHRYTKTHFVNLWNLLISGQISDEQYKSFFEKTKHHYRKETNQKPKLMELKTQTNG